ncbi:hypothetical protein CVD28_09045 [Bacillus sp. M6-12]|uniref:S-layer homology domain-containing protein n=1 Tax=Bacillus sp. M6-12 TaxID=2054166 RepID=UPI000C790DCA|nr:S-layer homology domain-containing protein [Bacillus sp. M6-12]PLS17836.1 hypothetical protein CVD28_09045 [Bacillus sp. M6-12]
MVKHFKKRIGFLGFIFVLLVGLLAPAASAQTVEPIKYLALGDSLAAGMTPEKGLSKGYSDFTAEYLKGENFLGTYSKAFAVPGYKTQNIIDDLASKPELRSAIAQSNVITISAGANDLLKEAKVDREKRTVTLDPAAVPVTLQTIAKNYIIILKTIKDLNPDASVYVMGYYFPFPFMADAQKPQLIQLAKTLNQTIQLSAAAEGAVFVSVYEKFGDDPKQFVPNPEDIHPNLDGYKLMSAALIDSMAKAAPKAADVPKGHWAEKELNMLVSAKLLNVDEKGNIYPEKAITRAEVADILFKSIPMTKSIPANPGYKDVPKTHPAYMAIAKLTEAGIFTKSDNFNPNAPLTRVQMAKVLAAAFQLKGDGSVPAFKDISATYWAAPYIDAVTDNHLMYGYKNGRFGLHDPLNRAQFAVVFARTQALMTGKK